MKILYAIQGTGNGHVARATEMVPLLKEFAEIEVLISGIQSDLELPFEVHHRFYGMSFMFGKSGGVDILKTILKAKPLRFIRDMRSLDLDQYDLILNDFEPLTAWACRLKKKSCIGVSHQNAVLHPNAPKPQVKDWLGKFILRKYAPSNIQYGFHFKALGDRFFTPVVRSQIRNATSTNRGHYTVYLPAYSDEEMIKNFQQISEVQWQVFSKHTKSKYTYGNVSVNPVSIDGFSQSFLSCEGILCNGGFETPAEALYLGKKLMVIPMSNQYEQQCNVAFLESMNIPSLGKLAGNVQEISNWVQKSFPICVNYPDITKEIISQIIAENYPAKY